jgi:predicted Zn-ribbon and HTH transcriptional regulator
MVNTTKEGPGTFQVTAYRCRCGHEWVPRNKNERPRVCPKCKSPNWDKPRRAKITKTPDKLRKQP